MFKMSKILRLVLLTLCFSIIGIIGCSKTTLPIEQEALQQKFDEYQLQWDIEREVGTEHEFTIQGYGKNYLISKDEKGLGSIATIEKDNLKIVTLSLIGNNLSDPDWEFAEEKKENWDDVLLLISDLYGDTQYAQQAYDDFLVYDEQEKDNSPVLFSKEYGNGIYYHVFLRKVGKGGSYYSGTGERIVEYTTYRNHGSIVIANKEGTEFFLEGIEFMLQAE